MRWPKEAFGAAPLHLAWRSEAISWKLFPIPKPHCPWSPELPNTPSQLPFYYCSLTALSLKPSFLKLSSSPLQPELCLVQLKPPFAGNSLRDSQLMSVVSAGRERCSIQQVPGSSPSLFNMTSPAPFFVHHPLLFLLLEEDRHSSRCFG